MNFSEFYTITYRYVLKFFYDRLENKSLAEDLTHDTYIRFYQKYGSLEISEEEAGKILYGFCRNLYKDYVRKVSKHKSVSFDETFVFEENDRDEGIRLLNKNKKLKVLRKAVGLLPPTLQKVIELRFLTNCSRKESAKILGIKEGSIHTYQKRAIKQLKDLIGKRSKL